MKQYVKTFESFKADAYKRLNEDKDDANMQTVGKGRNKIEFDSNKAETKSTASGDKYLQVTDVNTGKHYGVIRNSDGSYKFRKDFKSELIGHVELNASKINPKASLASMLEDSEYMFYPITAISAFEFTKYMLKNAENFIKTLADIDVNKLPDPKFVEKYDGWSFNPFHWFEWGPMKLNYSKAPASVKDVLDLSLTQAVHTIVSPFVNTDSLDKFIIKLIDPGATAFELGVDENWEDYMAKGAYTSYPSRRVSYSNWIKWKGSNGEEFKVWKDNMYFEDGKPATWFNKHVKRFNDDVNLWKIIASGSKDKDKIKTEKDVMDLIEKNWNFAYNSADVQEWLNRQENAKNKNIEDIESGVFQTLQRAIETIVQSMF